MQLTVLQHNIGDTFDLWVEITDFKQALSCQKPWKSNQASSTIIWEDEMSPNNDDPEEKKKKQKKYVGIYHKNKIYGNLEVLDYLFNIP